LLLLYCFSGILFSYKFNAIFQIGNIQFLHCLFSMQTVYIIVPYLNVFIEEINIGQNTIRQLPKSLSAPSIAPIGLTGNNDCPRGQN
jgi:hypothetical protein